MMFQILNTVLIERLDVDTATFGNLHETVPRNSPSLPEVEDAMIDTCLVPTFSYFIPHKSGHVSSFLWFVDSGVN
jgi:hypothetical protein